MNGRKKSEHYNIIKVLTTILVVVAHSTRMYTGAGVVSPCCESKFLAVLTEIIYSFHMPLFMAVSGMVYSFCVNERGKYTDSVEFIKNKVFRLIIPFLFFGFAYVAPVMVGFGFTDKSYFSYCLKGIALAKNPRHLWYILALFEIYVICAVLRKFISKFDFLILVLLFPLALIHNQMPITLQIDSLCYYLFFFWLGYLFNRFYEKIIERTLSNPVTPILLVAVFAYIFVYGKGVVSDMLLAVVGSLIIIYITALFSTKLTESRIYKSVKKNSFGIYLFHPMIIYVLFYYLGQKQINPIILSTLIAVVSFALSWGLTELFRWLRLGILIGEDVPTTHEVYIPKQMV